MKSIVKKDQPFLLSIWTEKCPKCGEGQVFEEKKHWHDIMPIMKKNCDCCHYKFDREPGYFLGAMYISYAIGVALGLGTFVLMTFLFPNLNLGWVLTFIGLVIVAFAQKNFKISRIIYIHLFPW
jgi:hypothetical protein